MTLSQAHRTATVILLLHKTSPAIGKRRALGPFRYGGSPVANSLARWDNLDCGVVPLVVRWCAIVDIDQTVHR